MISPFSVTNIYLEKCRLCYDTDDRICGGCCNIAHYLQNNASSLPSKSEALHACIRTEGLGSPSCWCVSAALGSAGSIKCLSRCQGFTMVLSSARQECWLWIQTRSASYTLSPSQSPSLVTGHRNIALSTRAFIKCTWLYKQGIFVVSAMNTFKWQLGTQITNFIWLSANALYRWKSYPKSPFMWYGIFSLINLLFLPNFLGLWYLIKYLLQSQGWAIQASQKVNICILVNSVLRYIHPSNSENTYIP